MPTLNWPKMLNFTTTRASLCRHKKTNCLQSTWTNQFHCVSEIFVDQIELVFIVSGLNIMREWVEDIRTIYQLMTLDQCLLWVYNYYLAVFSSALTWQYLFITALVPAPGHCMSPGHPSLQHILQMSSTPQWHWTHDHNHHHICIIHMYVLWRHQSHSKSH